MLYCFKPRPKTRGLQQPIEVSHNLRIFQATCCRATMRLTLLALQRQATVQYCEHRYSATPVAGHQGVCQL